MSWAIPLFLVIPLATALASLLLRRINKWLADLVANLATLSLLGLTGVLMYFRPLDSVWVYQVGGWGSPLGINLILDGFSFLLVVCISGLAFCASIYSIAYLGQYTGRARYWALFMIMLVGMYGVVLSGDLFTLFIFLEVAALASATLVAFGTEATDLEAALKYLVMGALASILILIGIGLVYRLTGTLTMTEIGGVLQQSSGAAKTLILVFFLVGFGTKAALVPFHAWLPDAHPAAPAPISALLSGVLIKALGLYALARIFYNVVGMTVQLSVVFLILGVISIFWGALLALSQNDLKRLLACSSISQVGYITLGLGLATPMGLMGALFHLFNHALIKPLLFLDAGAVEYSTGTREIDKLGGLYNKLPVVSRTTLIGALAVSGLPPFNGFWSKLFIILACIQAGHVGLAILAVVGSVITLAYFLRLVQRLFFGPLPEALTEVKRTPWAMGLPLVLMALLCVLTGIMFPYVLNYLINPAVAALASGTGYGQLMLGRR